MKTRRKLLALALGALLTAFVAGCGSDDSPSGDAELSAVATTTQVGDLLRNVGGRRVEVHQLLDPNSDPHSYEPRPSDASALAETDLVVRSGGELDEWLGDLIDAAGGDAEVVELIDSVEPIHGGHEHHEDEEEGAGHGHDDGEEHDAEEEGHDAEEIDPHWWQDPRNAVLAVAAIRDALVRLDPAGREVYGRNAARYTERLHTLDAEVAACIDRVPRGKRKLVTTHDALGYYADRYGLEVVGALIPSLSSAAQPSARDTSELVEQIREEGVEAVFPESALNPKLERAVADGSGAKVGRALWADALGPEGSSGATYLDSIRSNTESIVEGLSGGRVRCRPGA